MDNEPDIVMRLRDCTGVPHGEICREAADEIERLRRKLHDKEDADANNDEFRRTH